MSLTDQVRKLGRTAQVYFPALQDFGKSFEARVLKLAGRVHDPDMNGLRHIDVPPESTFLDIGANRGAATTSMLRLAPGIRIVAFEPNPVLATRLTRRLEESGGVLHLVALGESEGEFPLFIPTYRGVVFDGLASLSEAEAKGWLGPRTLFRFREHHLHIHSVTCRVAVLDTYGLRPFFIKIDVQGGEYGVLRGGLQTIAASEPIVFAESESLNIDEALSLLSPWGYSVYRYEDSGFVAGSSPRNVYFVPASKLSNLRNVRS